jgi:hypothetical protein
MPKIKFNQDGQPIENNINHREQASLIKLTHKHVNEMMKNSRDGGFSSGQLSVLGLTFKDLKKKGWRQMLVGKMVSQQDLNFLTKKNTPKVIHHKEKDNSPLIEMTAERIAFALKCCKGRAFTDRQLSATAGIITDRQGNRGILGAYITEKNYEILCTPKTFAQFRMESIRAGANIKKEPTPF